MLDEPNRARSWFPRAFWLLASRRVGETTGPEGGSEGESGATRAFGTAGSRNLAAVRKPKNLAEPSPDPTFLQVVRSSLPGSRIPASEPH